MRKKDILCNFSENPDIVFAHSMRKLAGKTNEYSALITFLRGCKDKFVELDGKQIQWAGTDYKMLMYLPVSEKWCLSAYYTPDDKLTFWYFDISRKNFVDEHDMPCIDDVFLDLVITPTGEKITLDEDELQEAFNEGIVSQEDVDNAYAVHDQIKNSKWSNVDFLNEISRRLMLEHEIGDIPDFQNFAQTEPITKGWSEDKKYCITKTEGAKLLLRVTPIARYETRKSLFELLKQVAALDIPMCIPLDFGACNGGVYSLQSWIYGEDLEVVLPTLSETEQYALGLKSGEILRKIHSIPAPKTQEEWAARFNRKTDRKIETYKNCGVRFDGDEQIINYIHQNRHLLQNRPQCFQHGDYHVGNMMIENGELRIIDFDRYDFGDPWEEFNRIVWCAAASPHFATGLLRGYFDGEPPMEFFKLLAFYIASNTLSSIYWAIPFGQSEIDTMMKQSQDVLDWYDDMNNPVPTWYLKDLWRAAK